MSHVPTYVARVADDGRLATSCPVLAGRLVVIRERKAQRSTQANNRYWALLTVAARELGYDAVDDLHEGLALKLLPLPSVIPGVPRRKRTPKLNTAEFAAYCEAVERFLIEMGVDLSEWQEEIPDGPD